MELLDSDGNRYTLAFEGKVTREKAVRLLDMVELLGGMPSEGEDNGEPKPSIMDNGLSKYERVRRVVHRSFPLAWFSSKEVQGLYEQEFKEPIGLSTVATYLSRLATKGLLARTGALNNLKYRLAQEYENVQVKQLLR